MSNNRTVPVELLKRCVDFIRAVRRDTTVYGGTDLLVALEQVAFFDAPADKPAAVQITNQVKS